MAASPATPAERSLGETTSFFECIFVHLCICVFVYSYICILVFLFVFGVFLYGGVSCILQVRQLRDSFLEENV